ncbi:MAG: zinc ribbon domain-containing protein [Gemmatimonadota bacterium]|jgi:putative FmdB family regulatory protein
MPTYDYACKKCGKSFQRVEKISQHGTKKIKCPACKSTRVEQVFGSVFVKTSKKS